MFLYIAFGFSLSSSVSRLPNLFTLFFYFWRWIFNAALIPSSVSLSIDCSRYFQVKSGSRYTSTSFEKVNVRTALQFNNNFWQTKCQWIFEVLTIMHFGCFYHGECTQGFEVCFYLTMTTSHLLPNYWHSARYFVSFRSVSIRWNFPFVSFLPRRRHRDDTCSLKLITRSMW